MSIKTTLHTTAPLLYPCWRYPKCPWGLYASPPPVAMAVVGWFLCFPAFFFWEKWVFFPQTRLTPQKKVYATCTKKNFRPKKNATYAKKKKLRNLRQKKNKKATYAYFHNRATLSSSEDANYPPPPHGASGQHLVAKGAALRSPWAPKAPDAPWAPKPPKGKFCPLCTPTLSLNPTLTLTPTPTLSLTLTLPLPLPLGVHRQ